MILIQILLLAIGFLMLVKGADWFVDGCSGIAGKLGIPQLVVGLTIVAMGTSTPEAAVSINASIKGNAGIAIGNIVGSNILNILIILGISAIIATMAIQKTTFCYEIPYMIFITIVLLVLGMIGGYVTRMVGVILWILSLAYLVYLFFLSKKGAEESDNEERPVWKLMLFMITGGVLVVWGSDVTVESATEIAHMIGLSKRFIGLTIVALGTSLPELVTSVVAAKRGNADIAIGNIVGSNIFNILFVIGTTSIIAPVIYEADFLFDGVIAVFAGVLLWISVAKTKTLRKQWGIIMLLCYSGYLGYLLMQ